MSVSRKHRKGMMGRLFSLCDSLGTLFRRNSPRIPEAAEQLYEDSFLSRSAESQDRKLFLLQEKTSFARACENSVLIRFFTVILHRTLLLTARTVAAFIASYLSASAIVAFTKAYLFSVYPSAAELVCAVILLSVLIPFLFSDSTLFRLLQESVLFGGFMQYVHPGDALRDGKTTNASIGLFSVFGLVSGGLTWFTGILPLPAALAVLLLTALVFCFPEAGFLLVLGMTPFLGLFETPSLNLAVFVSLLDLSLLIKILRGKKVLFFSYPCIPFFLFLTGVLLSAFSANSGTASAAFLTVALMTSFFLAYNLLRQEKLLTGAAVTMAVSAAFIALIGILQYMLGHAPSGWLDFNLFGTIPARTVSLFDNPNMLGAYLVVAFPFALSLIPFPENKSFRFFGILASALILACGILTFSRCCWIGLFLGLFLFVLKLTPRGLLLLPASAICATAAGLCFPDSIGKRLLHLFSLSDTANSYRVNVWNGTVNALKHYFFTGIGSGDIAFRAVYLQYCVNGTEAAPHSHSIYLQLALSCGIVTLLLFLWFVLAALGKSFRGASAREMPKVSSVGAAATASVISMLICGIADNVFYNYRILFLFFFACGVSLSVSEVCTDGRLTVSNYPDAAEISIPFYKKGGK